MSDSYYVSAYTDGHVSVLGIFDKRFKREPKWDGGCCTMTVTAESIEDAMQKAREQIGVRLKEGA